MQRQAVDHIAQGGFTIATHGRGFHEITTQVADLLAQSGIGQGIVHVFTAHTSCSVLISENADPAVRGDLERWMSRAVRDGDPLFEHDAEGPDDMPAHVRSVLTGASVSIPVHAGRLGLGTWQGIYLWEHRHAPHQRKVSVTVIGGADSHQA